MGGLHAGHQSLIERCTAENPYSVVSLFTNPTQFDDPQDLQQYPADFDRDVSMLEQLGVDAVLMPSTQALYPDDFHYRVRENHLSKQWCGAHRSGHFDGVLTVVLKLLNLVQPKQAYFGEKDYQQLMLVKGMVDALFLDTDIVACPTVRESDGLAMSSRNTRLNEQDRVRAAELSRTLRKSRSASQARQKLTDLGYLVDYVEDTGDRRLAAVTLSGVRLIDNIELENSHG